MTPSEKNIVKSLIAVAWADGKLERAEQGVIEGLLCGFDASEEEEQELLLYAKQRRTLERDIPLSELTADDREILLANAALLTHADGEQSDSERQALSELIRLLGYDAASAKTITESARDGALQLSSRVLNERG